MADSDPQLNARLLSSGGQNSNSSSNASRDHDNDDEENRFSKATQSAYKSLGDLSNLLPSGTYLAFQTIAPMITNDGSCGNTEKYVTIGVFIFFAIFCMYSCFTDSYLASNGKIYYGLVTKNGLWTPQLPTHLQVGDGDAYKLKVVDFLHAILSVAIFAAATLLTADVRNCFFPGVSSSIVRILPTLIGLIVSSLIVTFPTTRHGVGFPVNPAIIASFGALGFKETQILGTSASLPTKDKQAIISP